MSFATDLPVYNAVAPAVASTYLPLGTADGGAMNRISPTSSLAAPIILRLAHTGSGKGATAVDRHLIQHSWTKLDAAGVPHIATVNLTAALDRSGLFTQADIENQLSIVMSVLLGTGTAGFAGNSRVRDWLLNQV